VLVVCGVAYVALFAIFFMWQDWLIFPGRASQGRPWGIIEARATRGESLLEATSARGDRVVALLCPAADPLGRPLEAARDRPVMMLFHGNAESAANVAGVARLFAEKGVNVVVSEYPGYGMSSGKPGESAIYAGVDALIETLRTRPDIDVTRLVPIGWSLGAAVAIDTAARHPTRGVVALSPFTSIPAVARRTLWFFPVGLLARHRFDNLAKIPTLRVPIFLSHGRHDGIIPFEMAEELERAATTPVTTRWLDADHNDLLDVGGERLIDDIVAFARQCNDAATTQPTPSLTP
jgi:pimeloyl-ACP methyl ester carboxylesterase